ncbi:MAG: PEP/pyruvate-binding domain-containing protein [Myxococcota bacterium]
MSEPSQDARRNAAEERQSRAQTRISLQTRSGIELDVACEQEDGLREVRLYPRSPTQLVMHWGVKSASSRTWHQPEPKGWPRGSEAFGSCAVRSPLAERRDRDPLTIRLPATERAVAVEFVLHDPTSDAWDDNGGMNYAVELPPPMGSTETWSLSPRHTAMVDAIVDREMRLEPWSRVDRLEFAAELIQRIEPDDKEAFSIVFAWLRYATLLQLDWQRDDVDVRMLSRSVDRLTRLLADRYARDAGVRRVIRWIVPILARGAQERIDGRLSDLQGAVELLESVPEALDLNAALRASDRVLNADIRKQAWWVHDHAHGGDVVQVARATTSVREWTCGRGFDGSDDGRDRLLLDVALEDVLRGALERGAHGQQDIRTTVELVPLVFRNLLLSWGGDVDLASCIRFWDRLAVAAPFDTLWALRAQAAADRSTRALARVTQPVHRWVQPAANRLGQAFGAEPWTIELFSDAVVRERLEFAANSSLRRFESAVMQMTAVPVTCARPGGERVQVRAEEAAFPIDAPATVPSSRARSSACAVPLSRVNPSLGGRKSNHLRRLAEALRPPLHVPPAIVIPAAVLQRVLDEPTNTQARVSYENAARRLATAERPMVAALARDVREALLSLRQPPRMRDELRKIARDSEIEWDGVDLEAWESIKRVWASKWNRRAVLKRRALRLPDDELQLAVLVQAVAGAEYSYVLQTTLPASSGRRTGRGQVVIGLGETFDHPGHPLYFAWDKETRRIVLSSMPSKRVAVSGGGLMFRPDSAWQGDTGLYDSVQIPMPRQDLINYASEALVWDDALRAELLQTLTQVAETVERVAGCAQAIEGTYRQGECAIVQALPDVSQTGAAHPPWGDATELG